jgi:hypothetical protein
MLKTLGGMECRRKWPATVFYDDYEDDEGDVVTDD